MAKMSSRPFGNVTDQWGRAWVHTEQAAGYLQAAERNPGGFLAPLKLIRLYMVVARAQLEVSRTILEHIKDQRNGQIET